MYFPHFAFGKQVNTVWKTTLSCPPNNQGTAVGSARAEVESERPPRSRAHEPCKAVAVLCPPSWLSVNQGTEGGAGQLALG